MTLPGATSARDLDTRAQVHDLVIRFYREIVFDDLLGPLFDEVAEVDWTQHIPRLIDYWARILLHEAGYDGFILAAHQHVHALEPLRIEHFDRWYGLWTESVDADWSGPIADAAKSHAARIAKILARRILDVDWQPPRNTGVTQPGSNAPHQPQEHDNGDGDAELVNSRAPDRETRRVAKASDRGHTVEPTGPATSFAASP